MIVTFTLCKLQFLAGLHIGTGALGDESIDDCISSDKLFSAICSSAQLLYGDAGVESLLNDGAVRLSSAFPFLGNEYFFPKPLSYIPPALNEFTDRKMYKRLKYVPKEYFEHVIAGKDFPQSFQYDKMLQSCLLRYKPANDAAIYYRYEVPRIVLDRVTNASTIFHFSEIRFSETAGFYFLSSFDNKETEKIFMASLRLLGDEGIGADRTVGKGWFKVTEERIDLDVPESANSYVLLSQYVPAEQEIQSLNIDKSHYGLFTCRGWVTAKGGMTLRRQAVRAFTEGSVLTYKEPVAPKGKQVIVLRKEAYPALRHDIYRNFQAFALPFIIPEVVND